MTKFWRHSFVAIAFTAMLGGIHVHPARTAEEIGTVEIVLVYAYGTPPADNRKALYIGDGVVTSEIVETVKKGALHIGFSDGSKFRLGSSSRATLDTFAHTNHC